jgi:hypothetical protein
MIFRIASAATRAINLKFNVGMAWLARTGLGIVNKAGDSHDNSVAYRRFT